MLIDKWLKERFVLWFYGNKELDFLYEDWQEGIVSVMILLWRVLVLIPDSADLLIWNLNPLHDEVSFCIEISY